MTAEHHKINYIELPATDVDATKDFYATVFGWTFQDWGPSYVSFAGAGIDGGFDATTPLGMGGALVILYSSDLEASLDSVSRAGGTISRPIFSFPGGRRFHFYDPNGNELAVWGEDPESSAG